MDKTTQSLNLKKKNLTEKNLQDLIIKLKEYTNIKSLYLSENNLGVGLYPMITTLLSSIMNIEYLDISNNKIGDIGISNICEVFLN